MNGYPDILSYLRLVSRFLRSTELTRDFRDPNAFAGYCLTQFGRSCLARMAEGLQSGSGRRAWRLTGDPEFKQVEDEIKIGWLK